MSVANTGSTTAASSKQAYDAEFDSADTGSRDSPDEMKGEECAWSCYDSTAC